jgi:acetyl-CoA carboxylase biotin carboxyl carrier protein
MKMPDSAIVLSAIRCNPRGTAKSSERTRQIPQIGEFRAAGAPRLAGHAGPGVQAPARGLRFRETDPGAAGSLASPDATILARESTSTGGSVQLPEVEAHITGTVWKIEVEVGDAVEEGDTVVILESMKMEMPVEAEDPGVVTEIRCEEGQSVSEGDTLVVLG